MLRIVIFWLALLAVVLGALIAGHSLVSPPGLSKLIGFGVCALAVMVAWITFPNATQARTVLIILIMALICRVAIFEMGASTDINRYIWEGKLTSQGISPYQAPAQEASAELHDQWWQNMNHRDKFTAYPPVAMFLFAGLVSISESIGFFKSAFIGFDLLTLVVLLLLLKQAHNPLKHALLYAINPLVLFAFAGEAHYDSVLVFFTVLTLYCFENQKFALTWICLALAINIKIVAIILLPWLLLNMPKRTVWVLILCLGLPFLPFLNDIPNLVTGIKEFGIETSFNSPIHSLLKLSTGNIELASWICYGMFAVVVAYACLRYRDARTASSIIFTGFILCSSIIHYWYLVWAFPFVITSLRLAWFWLWITSGLYFLTSYSVDTGGAWELPVWAIIVQWLPFTALLFLRDRKILANPFWKSCAD